MRKIMKPMIPLGAPDLAEICGGGNPPVQLGPNPTMVPRGGVRLPGLPTNRAEASAILSAKPSDPLQTDSWKNGKQNPKALREPCQGPVPA